MTPVAASYRADVGDVLEILAEGLAPFVDREMSSEFTDQDWIVGAATRLGKREPVLASPTDPQFQLEVMVRWWGPVFSSSLSKDTRDTVQALRQSRNDWAHIDETHPIDLAFALRTCEQAEQLLEDIGSPLAVDVSQAADRIERGAARDKAQAAGVSETDVLVDQLRDLRAEREALAAQVDEAQSAVRSATGQQRAVARQLAELQTQYAAVSGLRERYRDLQQEVAALRAGPGGDSDEEVGLLADTSDAVEQLQQQSSRLEVELETARSRLESIDPVTTEVGRRWLLLVTALIMVLGVVVILAFVQGTRV